MICDLGEASIIVIGHPRKISFSKILASHLIDFLIPKVNFVKIVKIAPDRCLQQGVLTSFLLPPPGRGLWGLLCADHNN